MFRQAYKNKNKKGIEGLTLKPPKGDIKTLQGFTDNRKRLRIGKYRIIYNDSDLLDTLYIMVVDSRGDIYK